MRKVRDVLRLSAAGLSKRKIAASLGMSATAARDCIWRARRAGLAWPLPANRRSRMRLREFIAVRFPRNSCVIN
jgi:hypothetical protein